MSSVALRPPCELLALHPVGGVAKVVDRVAELLLDVLVGDDPGRRGAERASAEQLVVDVAGGCDRALDVLADLLVLECTLDVGPCVARSVSGPVLKLGHLRFLSVRVQATLPGDAAPANGPGGLSGGCGLARAGDRLGRRRLSAATPSNATSSTSWIQSTGMNSIALRVSSGSSSRSGSFSLREDHLRDPGALSGQHLLAQAPDRQHLPGEGQLAGHRDLFGHGLAGGHRGDRGRHRDPGRRPVLRHRAGGDVDVDVVLVEPDVDRSRARGRACAPRSARPVRTPA